MYLEKLEKSFNSSDLKEQLSIEIVHNLNKFIHDRIENGYKLLNPYRFAYEYQIPLIYSIQLFLINTGSNLLFKTRTFVDCPNCSGIRLEINNEDFVECEQCHRTFPLHTIKKQFYVLFELNEDSSTSPIGNCGLLDPNSTYDIIEKSSDCLKEKSPLSSLSDIPDKGDFLTQLSIEQVHESNRDSNGATLSNEVCEMTSALMEKIMVI